MRACCSRAARCCWRAGEVRASAIPRTARQDSDRPEQTAWWEQTVALFTGEPVFRNGTPVEADTPGDPSQAGFVQVMQGRPSNPDRACELMANDPADWQEFRPDILGTVSVGHDGDAWTMAIYFTSEEPAREGEQKEPPPEMQEMMKEMDAFTIGEPVFFDLGIRGFTPRADATGKDHARSEATTRVDSTHWGLSYCPRSCGARPSATRVRADWTLIATARRAAFECAAPTGLGRSGGKLAGHMSYRRARCCRQRHCRGAGCPGGGWVQRSINGGPDTRSVRLGPARTLARVMEHVPRCGCDQLLLRRLADPVACGAFPHSVVGWRYCWWPSSMPTAVSGGTGTSAVS